MSLRQHIFDILFGWPALKAPTPSEAKLISDLRAAVAALAPVPPGESAAEQRWAARRNELRRMLMERDPRAMLQWDWWKGFTVDSVRGPGDELKAAPEFRNYWSRGLREPAWGRVRRKHTHHPASGYSVHQTSMLFYLEKLGGPRVESLDFIVEFGASFGCMCRVAHQLGFRGTYVLFDFEEMNAIERFYLAGCDLGVDPPKLVFASTPEAVGAAVAARHGLGMFLSIGGITDVPLEFREHFLTLVAPLEHWFWLFQHQFQSLDNRAYCEELKRRLPERRWKSFAYPWLSGYDVLHGAQL